MSYKRKLPVQTPPGAKHARREKITSYCFVLLRSARYHVCWCKQRGALGLQTMEKIKAGNFFQALINKHYVVCFQNSGGFAMGPLCKTWMNMPQSGLLKTSNTDENSFWSWLLFCEAPCTLKHIVIWHSAECMFAWACLLPCWLPLLTVCCAGSLQHVRLLPALFACLLSYWLERRTGKTHARRKHTQETLALQY